MVPETSFTINCLFSSSPSLFLWKWAVKKKKPQNKQNWILFAKIVLKSSVLVDHFACDPSGIQSLFSHFGVQWVPSRFSFLPPFHSSLAFSTTVPISHHSPPGPSASLPSHVDRLIMQPRRCRLLREVSWLPRWEGGKMCSSCQAPGKSGGRSHQAWRGHWEGREDKKREVCVKLNNKYNLSASTGAAQTHSCRSAGTFETLFDELKGGTAWSFC